METCEHCCIAGMLTFGLRSKIFFLFIFNMGRRGIGDGKTKAKSFMSRWKSQQEKRWRVTPSYVTYKHKNQTDLSKKTFIQILFNQ